MFSLARGTRASVLDVTFASVYVRALILLGCCVAFAACSSSPHTTQDASRNPIAASTQPPALIASPTPAPAVEPLKITVFDGAHDKNTEAAFRWLNQQRRSK